MVKLVQQRTQLVLIIYFLLLVPYTASYKRLLKAPALNLEGKSSSDCPISQLGSTINSLVDTACGILGGVFFNIDEPILNHGEELRPEPGFYFQEPNTTANPPDQRGPCPGLNLLANYGYLPRNGIVTYGQVVEASARGFNMGAELASFLATVAVVSSGNILTQTFSLGGPDPRVGIGNIGGLNRHDGGECDISPTREDYYTGNCDNHHLSSRLFKQYVQFAKKEGGLFNLNASISQYSQNAEYSKTNNPYIFYFPASSIFSLATHIFYPYFYSNGTYEFGGKADYTTISTLIGANLTVNGSDYHFEYIPEKWPEVNNTVGKPWYRRGLPLGILEVTTLLPLVYLSNPVGMPFGQLGTSNLSPQTIACVFYLATLQMTPTFAAQTVQDVVDALTWVISKLDPIFAGTTFGCPANSFSTNGGNYPAYPFANITGSPDHPIPTNCSTSTNQYYKIYFPTAPK